VEKNWVCALFRYEELVQDPQSALRAMASYLKCKVTEEQLNEIVVKNEMNKHPSFNKGTFDRYKTEMSPVDRDLCERVFHDVLAEMNYEL
jgi:hypothetical protein